MPELPEVEIVKQSLAKKIRLKKIKKVIIKNRNLRFKIPQKFEELLQNKIIKKVTRFSKYLILINAIENQFYLISFIAVMTSAISTFYYLRLIK
jgi:formamidopyrimidine-DNA glycosylase